MELIRHNKPIVDFHIHILPGLDDGAGYWEESMAMAKAAIADGTTTLVVTPHYIDMRYHTTNVKLKKNLKEFKNLLTKANLPLEVYGAAEINLGSYVPELLSKGIIKGQRPQAEVFLKYDSKDLTFL